MSKAFYLKMAWENLRKNKKIYVPFILTSIFTTMMLYMIIALANNSGMQNMPGGGNMVMMLNFGIVVVELFIVIFLFYTNSFLLKRRKKEFGLYSVLGMEKKHLARVIFYELLFCLVISLGCGLALGMLFDKLMFLIIVKMLETEVPLGFSISVRALIQTAQYISFVYVAMFVYALVQVSLANPIELLHSGAQAEKEPKAKWFITLLGILFLGTGYAISLTITNPIIAMVLFFVAVICVIIGTYLLFTSGSISLLKGLEKNKRYYYRTNHFLSVSNMKFRMKQNAVSLANICILSTMVLVMLSTTLSLWTGMMDLTNQMIENDYTGSVTYSDFEDLPVIESAVGQFMEQEGFQPGRAKNYNGLELTMAPDGEGNYRIDFSENASYYTILTQQEYNKLTDAPLDLAENEVIIAPQRGPMYDKDTIEIEGKDYRAVAGEGSAIPNANQQMINNAYVLVVAGEQQLHDMYDGALQDMKQQYPDYKLMYKYYVNIGEDNKDLDEQALAEKLDGLIQSAAAQAGMAEHSIELVRVNSKKTLLYEFRTLYAGFLFIGLFLSILFIMAMILIMYYKQISEGYEDVRRYDIMKKVGLDEKQIKKTINTQVLTVFFLPLIVAGIHICFAFPIISKLLKLLSLSNNMLFVWTTIGCFTVFSLLYILIYFVTAKAYYKIVSTKP